MILACPLPVDSLTNRFITAFMGLFATNKAVERLKDRLETLEVLTGELERDRRKLDLEFTDLYDKVRHQMARMAKRASVVAAAEGNGELEEPIPDNLSHLDPVSRSIMMRRAKGVFKR